MIVEKKDIQQWAFDCALVLAKVVNFLDLKGQSVTNEGILRFNMFDDQIFGDRIEAIYK